MFNCFITDSCKFMYNKVKVRTKILSAVAMIHHSHLFTLAS